MDGGKSTKGYNLDGYETTAFLDTKVQNPKPKSLCCGKKCCCCTTSWKCCGIVTIVIVLFIGALIGGGALWLRNKYIQGKKAEEEMTSKSSEWDALLSETDSSESSANEDLITGKYELVSYSESYSEYLSSIGIPSLIVPLVLGGEESMNVTKVQNLIRFKTFTVRDSVPQTQDFKLGEVTEVIKSKRSGIMFTICTVPNKNIILCEIEQRTKSWNLIDKYEFSKAGVINTKEHVTKGVQAKKYFQRLGAANLDESFGKNGDSVLIVKSDDTNGSPFSDTDDDFGDDWDDF